VVVVIVEVGGRVEEVLGEAWDWDWAVEVEVVVEVVVETVL
jgi:hypothetical protein